MRSALYYPHTEIQNVELLKTALLLWDRIHFIVPDPDYRPEYNDRLVGEAIEIVGQPHFPSDDEKKQAHEQIEAFVAQPLPPPFYYRRQDRASQYDYEIYPQKFYAETFKLLNAAQLAGQPLPNADYPLSQPTGLCIMSILADCCAGTTLQRVTDRSAAYATLTGLLGAESARGVQRQEEQLVPITLEIVNADRIDLKRLVDLRRREEKTGGHAIRNLRHSYLDHIESYVKRLTTTKGQPGDEVEIKRQFRDDIADDLANLRDELRFARNDALFSKEMLSVAVALAGTIAAWAFGIPFVSPGVFTAVGAPVEIGGLLGATNKYSSVRRSILEKHPTAYLYQLQSPRIALL